MSWQRPPSFYPEVKINPLKQMRVVELQPGAFNDEVRCSLYAQDLNASTSKAKPYDALSYVWGDWSKHPTITLQGRPGFPVTANLYAALKRLRASGSTRKFWIDQICMNQKPHPNVEKDRQIPLMGDIYHQATEVIVWLGDAPDHLPVKGGLDMEYEQLKYALKDTEPLCKWQTRAWVIQEYVRAQREPYFRFGPCRKTRKEIERLVNEQPVKERIKVLNAPSGFDSNQHLFDDLRAKLSHNLLEMLPIARHTECREEHDKIYSLLALLPASERNLIKVDYSKKTEVLYAEATHAAIEGNGNLDAFAFVAHGNRRNSRLASWVMDFGLPYHKVEATSTYTWLEKPVISALDWAGNNMWSSRLEILRVKLEEIGDLSKPWCRSHPVTKAATTFSPSVPSLRLKGLEFDHVVSVVKPSQKSRPLFGQNKTEKNLFQAVATSENPYKLLQARRAAYFTLQSCQSREDDGPRYNESFNLLTSLVAEWNDIAGIRPTRNKPSKAWKQYMDPIQFTASEYGMYMMTRSGFLGYAGPDVEVGDLAVLPYGSRFPIALRSGQRAGTWSFKGLLWIHGVMENELYDRARQVELKESTFELV